MALHVRIGGCRLPDCCAERAAKRRAEAADLGDWMGPGACKSWGACHMPNSFGLKGKVNLASRCEPPSPHAPPEGISGRRLMNNAEEAGLRISPTCLQVLSG